MKKIGVIVQARMGSSRLPGKVLKTLAGKPMLEWILLRLQQSKRLDTIILATTDKAKDSPIVELAEHLNIPYFLGSEHDVLERYYLAAKKFQLTHILRITADCPFTDPELVDEVIEAFIKSPLKPDFAANNFIRTYPRGTDVAMMTFEALEKAWNEANEDYERVHVTPYIRQNKDIFQHLSVEGDKDCGELRWTVDTIEDFAFAEEIYSRLVLPGQYSWLDVLKIVKEQPELQELNSHIRQKALHEL